MHFAFAIASSRSATYSAKPARRRRRVTLAASLVVSFGLSFAALFAASTIAAPLAYADEPAQGTAIPGTAALAASASAPLAASAPDDTFLLTIFLRHDESKPLPKINDQLRAQGFFRNFPPPGIEVVSWYVMMGIGQVVTLRVPASRLREVNRAIESTAWGGYRTEFYPTYDYKAQAQQMRATDGK
ncbi:hypothetical protein [Paraburkholderia sp. DGU8]|uniref:hypothetical protein n=1 Tax=Paraburkholderia sp. DGU8 TaxID=3161997 RepID=UPI00346547B1